MEPSKEYLGLRGLLYAEAPRSSFKREPSEIVAQGDVESRLLLNAWFLLRQAGQKPEAGVKGRVLGIVMEEGFPEGCYTVAGFADGNARFFASGGFGVIGESMPENIQKAARAFIQAGQVFLDAKGEGQRLTLEEQHPLPGPGQRRLVFLTPGGVLAASGKVEEISSPASRFYPIFLAANDLITEFRLMSEGREKKKGR